MGIIKDPEKLAAFKKKISVLKKGTHHTEETKRKMSESAKAICSTPEEQNRRRERALKQWSDPERRKARSELLRKRYEDPEERRKTGDFARGRKMPEHVKKLLVDINKERFKDPDIRKRASESKIGEKNPMYGKKHSDEARLKISMAVTGRVVSADTRRKLSMANIGKCGYGKGQPRPAYIGKKISEVKKGKPFSDDHRQKLSAARVGRFLGENSNNWKGGTSFGPYCPKFNKEFKERVRKFFSRVCVECGTPETTRKHHVHHVGFNKETCCDQSTPMFVLLCASCHAKTQWNREYWIAHFTEMINTYYEGKCYLPKDAE